MNQEIPEYSVDVLLSHYRNLLIAELDAFNSEGRHDSIRSQLIQSLEQQIRGLEHLVFLISEYRALCQEFSYRTLQ